MLNRRAEASASASGERDVMVKTTAAVSARARARQAKAELDAQRAEQDRLVLDAATSFYEAGEALEAARQAVADAEELRVTAVAELIGLGQTDAQVGVLCGLAVKEVRELRRAASARPAPGPATAEVGPVAVEPAAAEPTTTGEATGTAADSTDSADTADAA